MKKFLAIFLTAAMALSMVGCGSKETSTSDSASSDTKKFVMGIDPEYPPFSYMGEDGNYTGFDVEVCRAACEELGWEFEVFGVNWDQKLIQLDAGECDCVWSGMTILDSMREAGYVISKPYFNNEQVFLVKESTGFKSSEDIKGKDIAVMLGTSGESLLNEDLADMAATFNNIISCESFLKCFTELAGNSVDAVFVDYPVAAKYAAENEGYYIIDEDFGAEEYGIAFRSSDTELCKQMDDAIAKLVENGTYAKIAAKEEYSDIVDNLVFLK